MDEKFPTIDPGREATVVPGRFGDTVRVEHAMWSRGRGMNNPRRPLFILLHGWGSNEVDIADFFNSYISPFSDYASLRAPLTLLESSDMDPELGVSGAGTPATGGLGSGAFTWFHDCVPAGEDLDHDMYAATLAIDEWVADTIPEEREVIPVGFSQGGALAVHLLRLNPERYKAAACLSGFLAPAIVDGVAPNDKLLQHLAPPVFYGFGLRDDVIKRSESNGLAAFLEENTYLKIREYKPLDHAVSLDECNDLRQWLMDIGASSGVM